MKEQTGYTLTDTQGAFYTITKALHYAETPLIEISKFLKLQNYTISRFISLLCINIAAEFPA